MSCSVKLPDWGVSDAARDRLFAHIRTGADRRHYESLVLTSNVHINDDGTVKTGMLAMVSEKTPLSTVVRMCGETLSGRIGMYVLSAAPKMQSVTSVDEAIKAAKATEVLDDYEETYGPFSLADKPGTPWVPQLDNGAAQDNMVALMRSSSNLDRYAIVVRSNASPQAQAAIKKAIAANPNMTLGEFSLTDEAQRLDTLSTLQNARIALRFAVLLGIDHLLTALAHPTEKTDSGEFAAAVLYAKPTGMAMYGDVLFAGSGMFRVSNGVIDLKAVQGNHVALVISPTHGAVVLSSPGESATHLALSGSSPSAHAVAAHPRNDATEPMGPNEISEMQRLVHFAGKSEATATMIAARLARIDASGEAFAARYIQEAGGDGLVVERFKTLGAIVFP